MLVNKATKLGPQVQKMAVQSRNMAAYLSGPPTVKVSPAEKLVHGVVMGVSFLAVPAYVLVNIKNYRGAQE